jgi:hypothetical protein
MSRALVRRASVMIVIAALALVALPAANARPLAGPRSTASAGVSWISALSTWVSGLFASTPVHSASPRLHATRGASSMFVAPMTGTCIDPNGRPIPCSGI